MHKSLGICVCFTSLTGALLLGGVTYLFAGLGWGIASGVLGAFLGLMFGSAASRRVAYEEHARYAESLGPNGADTYCESDRDEDERSVD